MSGKIITINRNGSIYLSKVLTVELGVGIGDRVGIANDEENPKDWSLFHTDNRDGVTIWNNARCGRFSNSYIAGMT